MQAIVMAAGMGSRLKNKTRDIPKALVKVKGKELLSYVLEFLKDSRINEIIIVGGYKFEKLRDFIERERKAYDIEIKVVENREYSKGNILSLLAALPYIRDDFILLNVDHIYNPQIKEIIFQEAPGITAICDFDRELGEDDMKVYIEGDTIKRIDKKLKIYNGGYVGITYVPKSELEIYKEAVSITSQRYEGNIHVEYILQVLADKGVPIFYMDISSYGWIEVDTEEDLRDAESRVLRIIGGGVKKQ